MRPRALSLTLVITEKRCTKCGETKPTADFDRAKDKKSGLTSACKVCRAKVRRANRAKSEVHRRQRYATDPEFRADRDAKSIAWRKANHATVSARTRRNKRMRRFGVSQARYDQMLAAQGGCCAICRRSDSGRSSGDQGFAVDHDHNSGAVRGLLCVSCNTGIGLLREDTAVLRRAIAYLDAVPLFTAAPHTREQSA